MKLKEWDKENIKPKKSDYMAKAIPCPKLKKVANIINEAMWDNDEVSDEDREAE